MIDVVIDDDINDKSIVFALGIQLPFAVLNITIERMGLVILQVGIHTPVGIVLYLLCNFGWDDRHVNVFLVDINRILHDV